MKYMRMQKNLIHQQISQVKGETIAQRLHRPDIRFIDIQI